MKTSFFKSYTEAKAFYDACKGDASISSSKKLGGWIVQSEEAETVPMVEQVHALLLKSVENNNMVNLDNVPYKTLGITAAQFSGYCSALSKQGKYYTQDDWGSDWAEVKP